jgi:hypothetical protein
MEKNRKVIIGLVIFIVVAGGASGIILSLLTSAGNSGTLTQVGQIDTNGETMNVQIRDNIAYVIDTQDNNPGGLMLINISNPELPVLLGSYYNIGLPNDFVLHGDLAYVANRFDGLEILNISDPQHIIRIGHYHPGYEIADVQIGDNIAFLGSFSQGFEIVNITDPTNPTKISNTLLTGHCINVCLDGDLLYVTDHIQYTNIEVYNISNLLSPVKVGEFILQDHDLFFPTIYGDYLYVADHGSTGKLLILDISNPTNIIEVARIDVQSQRYANRMCVTENILYMADYDEGLILVDISDPTDPEVIASYYNGGAGYDVAVEGNYIYFAARHGGLQILQYTQ